MLNRLEDVFASLNRHDVRYLVVGGIAAVLHGVPRATFDLDILIEPTDDNATVLLTARADAGLGTASLTTPTEVLANEITVFNDRVRVDVLTTAPGLDFRTAWERRVELADHGQAFWVVSRRDLIASKRASGRPVDLEDARLLELPDSPDG